MTTKRALSRATLAILATSMLVLPVLAVSSVPSGTWTVNYFSDNTCTTPWSPTMKDGGGFASNAPPSSNLDPVVSVGQTIYVDITVSGGAANTAVLYQLDGGNSPWPAQTTIFTTDGSGNGGPTCFGITITQAMADAVSGPSCTVPEKITVGSTFGNLDHLILSGGVNGCGGTTTTTTTTTSTSCTTCPPPVPEFPVSSLGLIPLLAIAIPLLILLRRRLQGFSASSR